MKFDVLTYRVAEMMGPPQKLTILADGEVTYESHSNRAALEQAGIGMYRSRLAAAEIDALSHSLEHPPFKDLPDHWGRIASGDRYQRVSLRSGSSVIEKMVGTSEPINPAMGTLLHELDQIVDASMHHPKATLRMTVSRTEVDASGNLVMDFQLTGDGTEAVELANPVKMAGSAGLSIRGWPDKAAGTLKGGDGFDVHAETVTELRGVDAADAAAPAAGTLRIAPGATRSFHVIARLHVPAAQTYMIQLVYQNTVQDPAKPGLLIGELLSRPIRLSVPVLRP